MGTGLTDQAGQVVTNKTFAGRAYVADFFFATCPGICPKMQGELLKVYTKFAADKRVAFLSHTIDPAHDSLPVLRDYDYCGYYKYDAGKLLVGAFEPNARPWGIDGISEDFCFDEIEGNFDHFEPVLVDAMRRVPALENAGIQKFFCGPESFTPDGNFILGEAPELRHYYVAAGFNSAGIANSGGAGRAIAEWIVGGGPPHDLADVDIRRFGPHTANKRALAERTGETLGLHYAMRWPRQAPIAASGRAARSVPVEIRLSSSSTSAWLILPRLSARPVEAARWPCARSTAASSCSTPTTWTPERASTSAIPAPIVPRPTTPTLLNARTTGSPCSSDRQVSQTAQNRVGVALCIPRSAS